VLRLAYIRVESSVSRHRKFLQAGPAASWLWLCGLAYCQEGLTNGFIPSEAIDHLGVKGARPLSEKLVSAQLWDTATDGWHVHDYLDWNKDAASVRAIQQERRRAGAEGGKASGETRRNEANPKQVAEAKPKQPANPSTDIAVATATEAATATTKTLDVSFEAFVQKYPAHRRSRKAIVQHMFHQASVSAGGPEVLFAALALFGASKAWVDDPRFIPSIEKWLADQKWKDAPVASSERAEACTQCAGGYKLTPDGKDWLLDDGDPPVRVECPCGAARR